LVVPNEDFDRVQAGHKLNSATALDLAAAIAAGLAGTGGISDGFRQHPSLKQ